MQRSLVGSAKALAQRVPAIRALAEARYERYFATTEYPCYRGVFESFQQARASSPAASRVGFNTEETNADFGDRFDRLFGYDYPVLFWLRTLFPDVSSVFDWGGHLGIHYHAYKKYLNYPVGTRWTVCEVPKVAEEGNRQVAARGERCLEFTSRPESADGHEILMAAGSLQYIETPLLPTLVSSLQKPPRHILINKIPVYDGPAFVTLQNIGFGFAPVRVWNRANFQRDLMELGYELVDSWQVPERQLQLPFHPDRSFMNFTGFYFRRKDHSR